MCRSITCAVTFATKVFCCSCLGVSCEAITHDICTYFVHRQQAVERLLTAVPLHVSIDLSLEIVDRNSDVDGRGCMIGIASREVLVMSGCFNRFAPILHALGTSLLDIVRVVVVVHGWEILFVF